MKVVDGDIIEMALQGEFDVLIYGTNCFGMMEQGLAASIKAAFPEAYEADRITTVGDKDKLGLYTQAEIEQDGVHFVVVNAYIQYEYRGEGNVDYEAVQQVFCRIQKEFHGLRIAYPFIGTGLGGGDWLLIGPIIERALQGEDHILVRFLEG